MAGINGSENMLVIVLRCKGFLKMRYELMIVFVLFNWMQVLLGAHGVGW